MKKKISTLFLLLMPLHLVFSNDIAVTEIEFTDNCEYSSESEACYNAIKSWTYKTIDEPICISHKDSEFVLMNLILDKKFKKTDKKAQDFISNLEKNRKKYFSNDNTYLDAFQDINDKLWVWWELWLEYSNYCNWWNNEKGIFSEINSCIKGGLSSSLVKDFLLKDNSTKNKCLLFAEQKLAVYRFSASQILKINKWQIGRDDNKKLMKKQRGYYDKLLDKFIANVRYLDSLLKWLPNLTSKTK